MTLTENQKTDAKFLRKISINYLKFKPIKFEWWISVLIIILIIFCLVLIFYKDSNGKHIPINPYIGISVSIISIISLYILHKRNTIKKINARQKWAETIYNDIIKRQDPEEIAALHDLSPGQSNIWDKPRASAYEQLRPTVIKGKGFNSLLSKLMIQDPNKELNEYIGFYGVKEEGKETEEQKKNRQNYISQSGYGEFATASGYGEF